MDMVELYAVPDVFVSALGRVDILPGGFGRFVFYVERDGAKIITASIIMSFEATQRNRPMIAAAIKAAGAPIVEDAVAEFLRGNVH